MQFGFIFMATRHDRTVPHARACIEEALALGVRNIGFKDIGLPPSALRELARAIREGGGRAFLEVVSLDAAAELASARAAAEIGVDWLLGGTRAREVAPIAKAAGIAYAPFPGEIVGHPSVLAGTDAAIVESARGLCAIEGVSGLDLLAYRRGGDAAALIRAVAKAVDKPVIVAGSIDAPERIAAVMGCGAAGFTVGSAVIAGEFPAAARDFAAQIRAIQAAASSLLPPSREKVARSAG